MYHQIAQSFDSRLQTCVIVCDISKAFDRVCHKGLLFKLQNLGIEGQLFDWVSNYLKDRRQRVFIGQSQSQFRNITSGVPQGSVLGPFLFLIYVNDITELSLITRRITRLFADETSLATTNVEDLHGKSWFERNYKMVKQWLVTFNPAKTEVLFFWKSNTTST